MTNMSDELHISNEEDVDFEEISSDEVDRVVASLESLIDSVESENIKAQLDEALNNIYYLVYDEEDEEINEAA